MKQLIGSEAAGEMQLVPSATAILDRFLHRAEVMQISGKSYRLEKPRKSSNDTKAPTGSRAEE